jgi:N-acetyl sugar amidotransferase
MLRPMSFPPVTLPTVDVPQRYALPSEVRFCKLCVISNQRPRISFDSDGICSAWDAREKELQRVCDRFRRRDGRFDVVVPCSGGKDSGFVSHMLKHRYGMHPLTVTWAPHWYTDVGRENLHSLVHSGFNNICFTPDGIVHRLMTRLAFVNLGDPFQPFIYGQKNFPLNVAVTFDIPLVMFGENGEVEYGGDMKNAFKPTHDTGGDMMKHYFSGISPEDWVQYGVHEHDLMVYQGPSEDGIRRVGVECHFMGYYHRWIPQELYYYCSERTGFQPNPDGRSEGTYSKYASLDDRMDGFHYYLAFLKFGIGRCTSDAAHEIRDGHITREEGVALVKQFDGEFPQKHLQDFLDYTGLTEAECHRVLEVWRNRDLWARDGGGWRLKWTVWNEAEQG